jgi:acyl carrier protein
VEDRVDAPTEAVDRPAVLHELRAALARIGVDPHDVEPTADLVEDLDLDSLDWVDLALQLEDALAIPLQEKRFASLRTVQDVVDRIHEALEERGDPPS